MKVSEIAEKLQSLYPVHKFMGDTFTPIDEILSSSETIHAMEYLCFFIQSLFCSKLEGLENGMKFKVDRWNKPGNHGGGVTCVIQDGYVIEKGGVNVSVISGPISESNRLQMAARGHEIEVGQNFSVVGISSVIHPRNPHVPTVHFNYRYFEVSPKNGMESKVFWFGGGCDITPYYLYTEDIKHFHKMFKDSCDVHDVEFYPRFKKWADDYFYISHREEHRGMGGIFFDDLTGDKLKILDFVIDSALSITPAYIPIVELRMKTLFTTEENEWKLVRRGRYVEFNLVYDRGTKFGFNVPGSRIESILMSLPSTAKWVYCHQPKPGSREEELINYTKNPIDWV